MRIHGCDRDLRATARFAGDAFHFDGARSELRHFHFEKLNQKARVAAREAQVYAAETLIHRIEIRADALAGAIALAGNLLLVRNDARRAAEIDKERAALHALHDARDDFAFLMAEFLEDGELLCLADLLDNDLLRRLCGDAAEIILRLKREDDFLAERRAALDHLRVLEKDVLLLVEAGKLAVGKLRLFVAVRMLEFRREFFAVFRETDKRLVDDRLHLFERNGARIHVELRTDYLSALSVFLLVCGGHRGFNSIDHHFFRDAAILEFPEHRIDCFEIQHTFYI